MSDKDFWTEVYLHMIKKIDPTCNYNQSEDGFINRCVYISDEATKCFKEKMKSFAKEAKTDIKKKEEIKENFKQSLR